MKRISPQVAKGKKQFKRIEHRPYSTEALKGPTYYTLQKDIDGFDIVKYYID